MLRLFAVSVVKNECDIIEAFVRHTAAYVDRHIILDNRSSDSTRPILQRLVAEGLNLEIRDDADLGHRQALKMNAVLQQLAAASACDYVLLLDADEFLICRNRADFEAALHAVPDAVPTLPWQTYVTSPNDSATERDVPRRMRFRRDREPTQFSKALVPLARLKAEGLRIDAGNHHLLSATRTLLPERACPGLALAHYPVRSSEQILAKVMLGRLAFALDPTYQAGTGFQWRDLAAKHRQHLHIPPRELAEVALTYAIGTASAETLARIEDPHPFLQYDRLRYADAIDLNLAGRFLGFAEQLVSEIRAARG